MARPKKDAPIDLGVTHELSEGLIARFTCPLGVPKAFLRDKEVAGLRVRVTANGAKAFVYEAKLNGRAIMPFEAHPPIKAGARLVVVPHVPFADKGGFVA